MDTREDMDIEDTKKHLIHTQHIGVDIENTK